MNYFAELAATLAQIDPSPLLPFVRACEGTLWLAGNGGSASIAQHWACDLSKAAGRCVQALGSNPAVLTAWANDEGYDRVFAEELERLARPGDRLICLSCSGASANIKQVIGASRRLDIPRMLVSAGLLNPYVETPMIGVPYGHYGIIEDCFSAIGHWLTEELRG